MADDHPDVLRPGAGHRQQVVDDRQGINAVDVQDPVEHQVHGLPDLSRVAVLDRQDRVIALALHDRQISLIKGREGDAVSLREDLFRRDMGEGARRPREGHPGSADQALLILPGNIHHFLHEHGIILPDLRVRHTGRIPGQDLFFLLLIQDWESPFPLVVGHIPDDLHPLLEEGRHLLVDLTYFRSCLLQISHHTTCFQSFCLLLLNCPRLLFLIQFAAEPSAADVPVLSALSAAALPVIKIPCCRRYLLKKQDRADL